MISKTIHYCWFGRNPKPKLVKKCIESWKKYCPDYQIVEWNEDNFNSEKYPYAKYCFDNQKYAFLSDYVRLVVIAENGGIYFDTDVQLIKKLDDLLKYEAFYSFENNEYIATGLGFGAEKGHITVLKMLEEYNCLKHEDQFFELIKCPLLNTAALIKLGLQQNGKEQDVQGAHIFPTEYFCPKDYTTGITKITKNTYSIHHYSASWFSKERQERKERRWRDAKKRRYKDLIIHFPNIALRKALGNNKYERIKMLIKKNNREDN